MSRSFILLFVVLLLVSFASLFIGSCNIPIYEVLKSLVSNNINATYKTIVVDLRLPRIIFSIIVGSGLSVAGASYQTIFRNPLVSPDILGVANGAAFGAAVGILLNFSYYLLILSSFTFGMLAVFLALSISKRNGKESILGLIVSGIVVGAFFTSLVGIAKYLADTNNQLPQIIFWLLGSFSFVTWNIWPIMIVISACILVIYLIRWQLNIVSLDEESAVTLGVNLRLIRLIVISLSTIITAASVSVVGIVGWIGLVVPHLARLLTGSDNVRVIPATILVGGILLLLSDDLARNIISGEIPISIITSLLGTPIFIYIYKNRRIKI